MNNSMLVRNTAFFDASHGSAYYTSYGNDETDQNQSKTIETFCNPWNPFKSTETNLNLFEPIKTPLKLLSQ